MTLDKVVKIGGGSAFFIDSAMAVPQLLGAGVDYIILDYLAEGAMGLLGRMKLADPTSGFPTDFMDVHIGPHLARIAETGTKIIANAGGVNPNGLVDLLQAKALEHGLKISCITGDDLMGRPDLFDRPDKTSCNAYLGAFPIAAALAKGADIVITGRVVDSALALGPLIHEFGWEQGDLAELAGGTVAGHLIECGAQVTGGTFTDWRDVEGWATIGSPIAECFADGSCIITKPEGTGGLVSFGTVAEQMLYEVGDPSAYLVPDVTVDFSTVRIEEAGKDRVRVSRATGHAPPEKLKAFATWDYGWRAIAYQPVIGPAAEEKAKKQAEALFERGRMMLRERGLADWRRTELVVIGNGVEVVAKLIVEHDEVLAVQMFAREQFSAISAMAPGSSVAFGVQVQPCMRFASFLVDRDDVVVKVDGEAFSPSKTLTIKRRPELVSGPMPSLSGHAQRTDSATKSEAWMLNQAQHDGEGRTIANLAYTRSGEKGETINIAVIARKPNYLPALRAALTPEALRTHFPDLGAFDVTIHEVPGIHALNIVLDGALPGGLNASQRLDPAAKSIGQRVLEIGVLT